MKEMKEMGEIKEERRRSASAKGSNVECLSSSIADRSTAFTSKIITVAELSKRKTITEHLSANQKRPQKNHVEEPELCNPSLVPPFVIH